MLTRILLATAMVIWHLTSVPAAVHAQDSTELQDQEARSLFEAGRLAFSAGRYSDALQSFQRAYELSQRGALLFNIGASLDRLRRTSEAITAFEDYIREVPDAFNRGEVEGRLRALREAATREAAREEELRRGEAQRLELEARLADQPETQRPEDDSIFSRWWFWTAVGVVVVGGVTTALVLSSDPSTEPATPGNTGVVWYTLGGS